MLYKPTQPSDCPHTHTHTHTHTQSHTLTASIRAAVILLQWVLCQTSVTSVPLMFPNASSHCQQQNTRNIRVFLHTNMWGWRQRRWLISGMEVRETLFVTDVQPLAAHSAARRSFTDHREKVMRTDSTNLWAAAGEPGLRGGTLFCLVVSTSSENIMWCCYVALRC